MLIIANHVFPSIYITDAEMLDLFTVIDTYYFHSYMVLAVISQILLYKLPQNLKSLLRSHKMVYVQAVNVYLHHFMCSSSGTIC